MAKKKTAKKSKSSKSHLKRVNLKSVKPLLNVGGHEKWIEINS